MGYSDGDYISARSLPGAYTGGEGGISMAGMGQDTLSAVPNTSGFNFGNAAIGAGASGLGSILALAPKLLGEAKQRAYQKKMAEIQAQQQRQEYLDKLTTMGVNEEQGIREGEFARSGTEAEVAAHGMQNSSVHDQILSEQKYKTELGLDAIRRQRARLKSGYAASLKLAELQRKAQKSAVMYDTIAQVSNAVGQAAGAAAMAGASDKNLKENIKPIEKGTALEVVMAVPVSKWNYKADKVNPRLGPMAQDVAKEAPEISDGHSIDMVSMNGLLMQAVKDLAEEVRQLKAGKK